MAADDPGDEPVRDPEAPEAPGERADAESFAQLVDALVAGERPPPVLAPEERALLQTATAIRAGHGFLQLPAERARALVGAVLTSVSRGAPAEPPAAPVAPLQPRTAPAEPAATPRRTLRALPWTVAAIAAAAALLLALRGPGREPARRSAAAAEVVPVRQRSRPADALVGVIARADSGQARARIDVLYADRLGAYRERHLGGSP